MTLFLTFLTISMFIDLLRWLSGLEYNVARHGFFEWMFKGLIGNAFYSFIFILVVKLIPLVVKLILWGCFSFDRIAE